MAKAKTEQEKRYFWFGKRPKTDRMSNEDRDAVIAQWLIGRMGHDAALELIRKTPDPFGNDKLTEELYDEFEVERLHLSDDKYKP